MQGYGQWLRLVEAVAPDGPGLMQVRREQGSAGLVAYPSGRSAMVFYGASDEHLAAELESLRARLPPAEQERLWVRFAPAAR